MMAARDPDLMLGHRVVTPGRAVRVWPAPPGATAVLVAGSDRFLPHALVREYDLVAWCDFVSAGGETERFGLVDVFVPPSEDARFPGPDLRHVEGPDGPVDGLDGLAFAEADPCFVGYLMPGESAAEVDHRGLVRRLNWHEHPDGLARACRTRRELYGPDGWVGGEGDGRGIRGWGRELRAWGIQIHWASGVLPEARGVVDPFLRRAVLRRCGYRCVYCGAAARGPEMHVDHVVPVAHRGPTVETNLVAACASCNQRKHATVPSCPECGHRLDFGFTPEGGIAFGCERCGPVALEELPWIR